MQPFFAAIKYHRTHESKRPLDCLHFHDHHEIFLALSGSGKQMTVFGEREFKAGDLFFFPEGQLHMGDCEQGQSFECLVISFDESFCSKDMGLEPSVQSVLPALCHDSLKDNLLKVSAISKESIRQLLFSQLDEFNRQAPGYQWAFHLKLQEFFLLLLRDPVFQKQMSLEIPNRSNEELIQEVMAYVQAFYYKAITIDDILEFCPLSKSHFHAVFKHETGQTFIHYLTEVRLKNACEWLTQSKESVTSIAFRCGFNSQSHFSYIFQKTLHTSPKAYRETKGQSSIAPTSYAESIAETLKLVENEKPF